MPTSCEQANVVFLAVKPQNMAAVFAEIGGALGSEKLVVSIAAGVTIARLCEGLKTTRVVRVMHDTAATVAEGASAYASAPGRRPPMASLWRAAGAVGQPFEVDEKLLDAVTGLRAPDRRLSMS